MLGIAPFGAFPLTNLRGFRRLSDHCITTPVSGCASLVSGGVVRGRDDKTVPEGLRAMKRRTSKLQPSKVVRVLTKNLSRMLLFSCPALKRTAQADETPRLFHHDLLAAPLLRSVVSELSHSPPSITTCDVITWSVITAPKNNQIHSFHSSGHCCKKTPPKMRESTHYLPHKHFNQHLTQKCRP